ncbi:MAG: hypothetical protein WAO61_02640 [Solirubrobacterales bacterium]
MSKWQQYFHWQYAANRRAIDLDVLSGHAVRVREPVRGTVDATAKARHHDRDQWQRDYTKR